MRPGLDEEGTHWQYRLNSSMPATSATGRSSVASAQKSAMPAPILRVMSTMTSRSLCRRVGEWQEEDRGGQGRGRRGSAVALRDGRARAQMARGWGTNAGARWFISATTHWKPTSSGLSFSLSELPVKWKPGSTSFSWNDRSSGSLTALGIVMSSSTVSSPRRAR